MNSQKKLNISLSDRNPNTQVIDGRLKFTKNNGDKIFLSEKETEFFFLKLQELIDSGASKEVISEYAGIFIDLQIYLNTLTEEERDLFLKSYDYSKIN